MTKKVVILTAGAGSRLNERTKYFNKALLKVGNQAAISHIIDLFPRDTEFVIATGHLGQMVSQYLRLAHPDGNFVFVPIDRYSVPGAGPAYALDKCRDHLREPFFFVACDTIIEAESFKKGHLGETDYMVYDTILSCDIPKYCTLNVYDGQVIELFDKTPDGTRNAFTGFAHIQSWQDFWDAMDLNQNYICQELQLSPVFAMLPSVQGVHMHWYDVGNERGLLNARRDFEGIENLDKLDEELYVVEDKVIKYFYDSNIVQKRIQRTEALKGLVPELIDKSDNFYSYKFVEGEDMFEHGGIDTVLPKLLKWAARNLWMTKGGFKKSLVVAACESFYQTKTEERLKKFFDKTHAADAPEVINGTATQPMSWYMGAIDWKHLCEGAVVSCFHGDFQPGNVIVGPDDQFTLIDWRQEFGGIIEYGDRYYDFAKLYCSLLMPHPSIKNGDYLITRSAGEVFVHIVVPEEYNTARKYFENWLTYNGYSIRQTVLLAAIVMLNMAPLHEHPLDQWLYYFSKLLLSKIFPTGNRL
jgi:NDP-sugar pyrophosphorylase family protein